MQIHINDIILIKLYAFTYNLVYLLKFVAKAYNYDDTSRFCKREKK